MYMYALYFCMYVCRPIDGWRYGVMEGGREGWRCGEMEGGWKEGRDGCVYVCVIMHVCIQ